MKKILVLFAVFSLLFLSACSVQKNMSPEIFLKRLSENSESFDSGSAEILYDDGGCVCFIKDIYGTEYVFRFDLSDAGDINKISFACNKKDKAENYILCLKEIICIYASDESPDEIIKELTENGKIKQGFSDYETHWYFWSSYADENGFFTSVINKKLVEITTAELTLKPNDKSGF